MLRWLGELSASKDFAAGALLTEDSGTSFAAPHVTHLAGLIVSAHPQADHNLLRALLVAHERWPQACEELLTEKNERLRVCGFGKVDDEALARSTEHHITLIATDAVADRYHHFHEIRLPASMVEGAQRTREVTVALAHSPAVRTTRIFCKSCQMEFRVVWADSLDRVAKMFNVGTSREEYQRIGELGGAQGARHL